MKFLKTKLQVSRRAFSRSLISLGASAPMLSHSAFDLSWFSANNTQDSEMFISAQGRHEKQYGLGWVDPKHTSSDQLLSSFRGHGLCQNPILTEQIIMFSRRPGTQGIRFNSSTGTIDGSFTSAKNRHMHGHGCYSLDGKKLYCVESEISTGQGKITVRDGNSLALINEFDSHGIGPHEIAMMPDGITLVVANGGLLTHPDSGRKVLNYETMRSTLSYINSNTGALISEHFVAESKASIRHLDVAEDGTVAIALQVQRQAMSDNHLTSLAAVHQAGQEIKVLTAPEALTVKLNDYMGSVKIHSPSRTAAFTSPKGDLVLFWHLDDLSLQGYHAFNDVCGLAISQDNKYFVLSSSTGKIRQIHAATLKIDKEKSLNFPQHSWDNHMISVLSHHA
ncbi:MAG: DUF1513 domain-containing protein [Oleispira antarctica]|nr:DUF1513 domain-containing protein [Oleispira antarctica]MBQ0793714.1 DUF1513 domain-containing protein [Oleispira antarctica]